MLLRNPVRFVWFSELNMSVRICSLLFHDRKFLAKLKSRFQSPGLRTIPGPALPGVIGAPEAETTGISWKARDSGSSRCP